MPNWKKVIVSGSDASLNSVFANSVTASIFSGSHTGPLTGTASWATNALTASSADNFTVRGTLTAQTIVTQVITSSTDFVTGSTRFGSLISNTHQFTGSVSMTGSLTVIGFISASSLTSSTDAIINSHTLGRGAGGAVENTAFGFQALIRNTTANRNTAMGWFALSASNAAGASSNTAVGAISMRNNLSGTQNSAFGEGTLFSNTSGQFNTAVGYNSLASNTNGSSNVAIGWYAGDTLGDGATANTTADNSIYIGVSAYASQSNGQNEIVIGASNVGHGSNTVTLGNSSITRTVLRGNVGIGTTSSSYKLHVADSAFPGVGIFRDADVVSVGPAGQSVEIGARSGSNFIPAASIIGGLDNPGLTGNLTFQTRTGNTLTTKMFISSSGNVGIGTTSPSTALHVVGAVSASAFTGSLFGTASFAVSASWAPSAGGSSITIADESVTQGTATYLNFLGAGVTAAVASNTASITISGGGGGGTPGGANTTIQFNDSSTFSGSGNFTFTKATNTVKIQGSGSTLLHVTGSGGDLFRVVDSGSNFPTIATFSSGSVNVLTVTTSSVIVTGSLNVNGGITGSLLGTASFATTASFALNAGGGGGGSTTGSILLTAAGGWPSLTNGCQPPQSAQTTTNQVNFYYLGFPDGATTTFANWAIPMPADYNGGTITAVFYWVAGNASTNSVVWGLAARAYADSDVLDQAFGTQQQVTDANQANDDVNISAATPAITIGGTPAAGNFVQFRANRDPANASDTLAATAELLAIRITYTRV